MFLPPGLHQHCSAADYHADPAESPSLSSSVAKLLIEKPPIYAKLAHPRLNKDFIDWHIRQADKDTTKLDLGSIVHELILGKGSGLEILDFQDYRKRTASEARDSARAAGLVPVLSRQYNHAMAIRRAVLEALQAIPDGTTFEDGSGVAETVLVWRQEWMMLRAMVDWIGPRTNQIWDIKTTSCGLSDSSISRSIVTNGYDLSAAFYIRGMTALFPDLAGRVVFRWIFVETDEPFETRVIEVDAATLAIGDRKVEYAIKKWRMCLETNTWPGYPRKIERLEFPPWAENSWLEQEIKETESDS